MEADFSGYATKAGLKCSDGRTIMREAFKHMDGKKVPLVWQHSHSDPANVLGHAFLEDREDGVYAYAYFNGNSGGQNAKTLVQHGDIVALSIYANQLVERAKSVFHGTIREVSLVLSGANPGALIDNVALAHGDGEFDILEDEAIIFTGLPLEHEDKPADMAVVVETVAVESTPQEVYDAFTDEQKEVVHSMLEHATQPVNVIDNLTPGDNVDVTIQDVYDGFTEEQKNVVHYMVSVALESVQTNTTATHDNIQHASSGMTTASNAMGVASKLPVFIGSKAMLDAAQAMMTDNKNGDNKAMTDAHKAMSDAKAKKDNKAMMAASTAMMTAAKAMMSSTAAAHADGNNTEGDLNHMEGTVDMTNVFEQNGTKEAKNSLSHEDVQGIVASAMKNGSLKDAVEDYALQHGIDNIGLMFPDATAVTNTPEFDKRRTEWVAGVIGGTRHTPFSRIKSLSADLTFDAARAKGYIKGNMKKEEFFGVGKRVTTPTTIYKRQKLDRDDIIDITDFDVVSWLKFEMRFMLDEELARAVLVGDGRDVDDPDKINETNIRPISKDAELYATTAYVNLDDASSSYNEVVESILLSRRFYKGSGTPTFYTTEDTLTRMLLAKDNYGRRLYNNEAELALALRVSNVVAVPVMEDDVNLVGIVVNLYDYTLGADKGGDVNLFDDFDIDYNQYKYMIETRVSGALTKIKSALIIRKTASVNVLVDPVPEPTYVRATKIITIPAKTGVVYKIGATTLVAGPQAAISVNTTVDAVPAAGYYFATNAADQWIFTIV